VGNLRPSYGRFAFYESRISMQIYMSSKSDLNAGHRWAVDLSLRRNPLCKRLRSRCRAARRDATYDAEILRGI